MCHCNRLSLYNFDRLRETGITQHRREEYMPTCDMYGLESDDDEELVPRGARLVLPQQDDPQGPDQSDALPHHENYVYSPAT